MGESRIGIRLEAVVVDAQNRVTLSQQQRLGEDGTVNDGIHIDHRPGRCFCLVCRFVPTGTRPHLPP